MTHNNNKAFQNELRKGQTGKEKAKQEEKKTLMSTTRVKLVKMKGQNENCTNDTEEK